MLKPAQKNYNIISGAQVPELKLPQIQKSQSQPYLATLNQLSNRNGQKGDTINNQSQIGQRSQIFPQQQQQDEYHLQNIQNKRTIEQPKQQIIDYKAKGPPQGYNNHFTVTQNYKTNNQGQTSQKLDSSQKWNNTFDQKYHNDVQNYRNNIMGYDLKEKQYLPQQPQNSMQNLESNYDQLYHNYQKNASYQKKLQEQNKDNDNRRNVLTGNYQKMQDRRCQVSMMNYKSVNYDPINFSEMNKQEKQKSRKNVYQMNNFKQNQKPQFGKGGAFTRYLDELKISSINANPVYDEKFQEGNLDFKLKNGDFTRFYNIRKGTDKPFKNFK